MMMILIILTTSSSTNPLPPPSWWWNDDEDDETNSALPSVIVTKGIITIIIIYWRSTDMIFVIVIGSINLNLHRYRFHHQAIYLVPAQKYLNFNSNIPLKPCWTIIDFRPAQDLHFNSTIQIKLHCLTDTDCILLLIWELTWWTLDSAVNFGAHISRLHNAFKHSVWVISRGNVYIWTPECGHLHDAY